MSVGLEIFNNNNRLIINESFKNLCLQRMYKNLTGGVLRYLFIIKISVKKVHQLDSLYLLHKMKLSPLRLTMVYRYGLLVDPMICILQSMAMQVRLIHLQLMYLARE